MTRARCPIDDVTLSAHLDREVGWLEGRRIARHLERCECCRHRYDRLRRADAIALLSMRSAADGWLDASAPTGEGAAHQMIGRRRLDRESGRRRRRLVGLAAVVLLGVVAAVDYSDPCAAVSNALYRLGDRNADRSERMLAETRSLRETIATLRAELVSAELPAADRSRLEDELAECAEFLRRVRAAARGIDGAMGGTR